MSCSTAGMMILLFSTVAAVQMPHNSNVISDTNSLSPGSALSSKPRVMRSELHSEGGNRSGDSASLTEKEAKGTEALASSSGSVLRLIRHSDRPTADTAVVTSICSDAWVPGALALAGSMMKNRRPKAELIVMISDAISDDYHDVLGSVFDKVYLEKFIRPHPSITRKAGDCVTLKFWSWTLPFTKVMYIDSDILMFTSPDTILANYRELAAKADTGAPNITSGPGKGHPGWNSGYFVLEPNLTTFQKLDVAVRIHEGEKRDLHGDQQFLNFMFPRCQKTDGDESLAGCWSQDLHASHNVFARDLSQQDATSLITGQVPSNRSKTVKSLHFSGNWDEDSKPWLRQCMHTSDAISPDSDVAHRQNLVQIWFREFEHVKPYFKGKNATSMRLDEELRCPCRLAMVDGAQRLQCTLDDEDEGGADWSLTSLLLIWLLVLAVLLGLLSWFGYSGGLSVVKSKVQRRVW